MISRRNIIKIIGLSFLSFISFPYRFLYSATKKIINKELSEEQKKIMFNEGTERPFTSDLLKEDRKGFYHCANCGVHHGHVFLDGPTATGKRFCNNGLCLIFKPEN